MNLKIIDRIRNLIRIGKLILRDGEKLQIETNKGTINGICEAGQYGFYSATPMGRKMVILNVGANPNTNLAVASLTTEASKLEEGEVAIAHQNGTVIKLTDAGGITIKAKDGITIENTDSIIMGKTKITDEGITIGETNGVKITADGITVGPKPVIKNGVKITAQGIKIGGMSVTKIGDMITVGDATGKIIGGV